MMAKRRRKPPRIQDVGDPPTPETLAKLKPCPLDVLYRRIDQKTGRPVLEADEVAAGYDLLAGYTALTAQLKTSVSKIDNTDPGNGGPGNGLGRLAEIYLRWRNEMARRSLITWPVMDALVDLWVPPEGTSWGHHIGVSLRIYIEQRALFDRETKNN